MRIIILELVHGQGEKKKCEYERDGITKIFNKGSLFEELILLNIHKKIKTIIRISWKEKDILIIAYLHILSQNDSSMTNHNFAFSTARSYKIYSNIESLYFYVHGHQLSMNSNFNGKVFHGRSRYFCRKMSVGATIATRKQSFKRCGNNCILTQFLSFESKYERRMMKNHIQGHEIMSMNTHTHTQKLCLATWINRCKGLDYITNCRDHVVLTNIPYFSVQLN